MFGLFCILGNVVVRIGNSIYERKKELDCRKHAINNRDRLWIDRRGTAHHTENDEPFHITTDYTTGHKIEINPYTQKVVKDLTAEYDQKIQRESLEKAKAQGRRVYPINDNSYYDHLETPGYKNMKGRIWIDRVTGKKYLRRVFFHIDYWYLSMETGLYEFPDEDYLTDGRKHYVRHNGKLERMILTQELIDETLDYLNDNQRRKIDCYGLNDSVVWENSKACI